MTGCRLLGKMRRFPRGPLSMRKILFSDHDYRDISLERDLLARQGIEIEVANCRSEDDVIRAAKGFRGILL